MSNRFEPYVCAMRVRPHAYPSSFEELIGLLDERLKPFADGHGAREMVWSGEIRISPLSSEDSFKGEYLIICGSGIAPIADI